MGEQRHGRSGQPRRCSSWLAAAWLVWLLCMLTPLPFTRVVLALAVVVVGSAAWFVEYREGRLTGLRTWLRNRRVMLIVWEAVFLAGFVLFAVLRSRTPAIISTEKPMDMAFLNGFMAAQRLPTQDTWLAGVGVPYYHFGYFVLACVGKLSGVSPGVAYNLAAALVPALTVVGLASLVWNLARAASVQVAGSGVSSGVAVLLVVFAGNLSTFFEFVAARGNNRPRAP